MQWEETQSDLNDHLDGGQGGGDVLRVGGSHCDGNTAGVQAAVKRCDQVDACSRDREKKQCIHYRQSFLSGQPLLSAGLLCKNVHVSK